MKHLRIDQHILQNVAPSNLNRDDMGAPKDAMFGGFRRARISSQATKRSVRKHMEASGAFDETGFGVRTKLLPGAVAAILGSDHDPVLAATVASLVLEAAGLRLESETGKLATLLFVPAPRIRQIAGVVHEAWKGLTEGSKAAKETELAAVGKRIAALLADERCAPALVNIGNLLLEDGHVLDAVDHYESALRIDDGYAPAHGNLGVAFRRLGRGVESIRALKRAARLSMRRRS